MLIFMTTHVGEDRRHFTAGHGVVDVAIPVKKIIGRANGHACLDVGWVLAVTIVVCLEQPEHFTINGVDVVPVRMTPQAN